MSIIEQAAQRLEQLRRAGVEAPVPGRESGAVVAESGAAAIPTPERLAHALESASSPSSVHSSRAETRDAGLSAPVSAEEPRSIDPGRRSKLVEIDLEQLAAAGFLTPEGQRSQLGDEFRVLKRPIIKNAQGKSGVRVERGNRVMVTSSLPKEGKSFVALNLAMSIASEVDTTVLLVDADVANPSLMRNLHLPRSKGLLDLLTDDTIDMADVLLRTNVEKLALLPAGTAHRRATEMLASQSMADLIDEMASRYPDRIIVFDSPPLLAATEARVLATLMGQIIMVVEADMTTQVAVNQALDTIEDCPVVLTVLNKAPRSDVGSYYGYGAYGTEP